MAVGNISVNPSGQPSDVACQKIDAQRINAKAEGAVRCPGLSVMPWVSHRRGDLIQDQRPLGEAPDGPP